MEQGSVKIHSWCPSQGQVKLCDVALDQLLVLASDVLYRHKYACEDPTEDMQCITQETSTSCLENPKPDRLRLVKTWPLKVFSKHRLTIQSNLFSLDLLKTWHFETAGWFWGAVKVSEVTSEGLKLDMWVTLCDVLGASLTGSLSAKSRFSSPRTMIVKHALSVKKPPRQTCWTGVNNEFCQLMVLAVGRRLITALIGSNTETSNELN